MSFLFFKTVQSFILVKLKRKKAQVHQESVKLRCKQWQTRLTAAPSTRQGATALHLSYRCICGSYKRFLDVTTSLQAMAFPVEQNLEFGNQIFFLCFPSIVIFG